MNIKNISRRSLSLLLALAIVFPFIVGITTSYAGTGAENDPYTVQEAIENNSGIGSVEGYIVGSAKSGSGGFVLNDKDVNSNIVIADSKDEKDTSKMMVVQLPNGELRNSYNLVSNLDLLGTKVKVTGSLEKYFAKPGLKNPTSIISIGDSTPEETVEETVEETKEEVVENKPKTNVQFDAFAAVDGNFKSIEKLDQDRAIKEMKAHDNSESAYVLKQNGEVKYNHNPKNSNAIYFLNVEHGIYELELNLPSGYTINDRTFKLNPQLSKISGDKIQVDVNSKRFSQNMSLYFTKEAEKVETKVIFNFVDENGEIIEGLDPVVKNAPVTIKEGHNFTARLRSSDLPEGYKFAKVNTTSVVEKVPYGETAEVDVPLKVKDTEITVSFNVKEKGTTTYLPELVYKDVLTEDNKNFKDNGDGTYTYKVSEEKIPVGYKQRFEADSQVIVNRFESKKHLVELERSKGKVSISINQTNGLDKKPIPVLVAEDGTEYELKSNSTSGDGNGGIRRLWETEKEAILSGSYKLIFRETEKGQIVEVTNSYPNLSSKVKELPDKETKLTGNIGDEFNLTFNFDQNKFPSSRYITLNADFTQPNGKVIIKIYQDSYSDKTPVPVLVSEDGTEYSFNYSGFGSKFGKDGYTEWKTDNEAVPSGEYKLKLVDSVSGQTLEVSNDALSLDSRILNLNKEDSKLTGNANEEFKLVFDFDGNTSPASRFVKVKAVLTNPEVEINIPKNPLLDGDTKVRVEASDLLKDDVIEIYADDKLVGFYKLPFDGATVKRSINLDEKLVEGQKVNAVVKRDVEEIGVSNTVDVIKMYQVGIEVRDLDNKKTSDIKVEILDKDGNLVNGKFNNNLQYLTNSLNLGTYTVKLSNLPENAKVVLNENTFNKALETENKNEFTLEVSEENLITDSSNRVWGAFKLVEDTLTVEYKVNSNAHDDVKLPETQEVVKGTKITLPELELPKGKVLLGYNVNGGKYSVTNQAGDEIEINEDTTIVAIITSENAKANFVFHEEEFSGKFSTKALNTDVIKEFNAVVKDENKGEITSVLSGKKLLVSMLSKGTHTFEVETPGYEIVKIVDENGNELSENALTYPVRSNGDNLGNRTVYVQVKEIESETPEQQEEPKLHEAKGYITGTTNVRISPNGPVIGTLEREAIVEGEYEEGSDWVKFDYHGQEAYVYKPLLSNTIEVKGFSNGDSNIRKSPNGEVTGLAKREEIVEGVVSIDNPNWIKTDKGYIYRPLVVDTIKVRGLMSGTTNVRMTPNGTIMGTLGKAEYVEGTLNITNPNWVRIRYQNRDGYVYRSLIVDTVSVSGTVTGTLNVRQTPNGKVLGAHRKGVKLTGKVYAGNPNWIEIQYKGQRAYVYKEFVK